MLGQPQQGVRARQVFDGDEVGQPRVHGRPGEAGGDAGDERERDDLARRDREREQDEDDQTDDVGADEQPLPREAVDERTEQEPDGDRRQEIGDQQRR